MKCRFCGEPVSQSFADLGMSPLSNAFVTEARSREGERIYPLHAYVCGHCFLVQLDEFEAPEVIFDDYVYFSSFSTSWLEHARRFCAETTASLGLDENSRVVEVASNDGYLLQYFLQRNIPVLGIEPAGNVAEAAREKGIPTVTEFLGEETGRALAAEHGAADLLVANNVLAHVPDINDFVAGMRSLLAKGGTLSVEFPSLMNLIRSNQFDTIYHEHFSYLSLTTVERIFAAHDLTVSDVAELETHGGSLRVFAKHAATAGGKRSEAVGELLARERDFGLTELRSYTDFQQRVHRVKCDLLRFLMDATERGKRVVAYGAPAKGNTLLNYCGIGRDFLDFTVDRNPKKQGSYLPGSRIPVLSPEALFEARPDYVLVLPWNIFPEIREQLSAVADWGGRFVLAIPELEVI